MKRLLHALAVLWPLVSCTRLIPCEFVDLPIRKSAKGQPSELAHPRISESTLNNKTIFHLDRRYCNILAYMTLFMCLIAAIQAPAQTGAAANMDEIQPLQIGDTIPEELWHLPLQVVNHPEGKETITLNDYRGKLIILDFWGTFCSSCIAAMPKIAEVQRQFSEDMVVVPVSWSKPEVTEKALLSHQTLMPLALSSVVGAQVLIDVFPHGVVPHYVWIGTHGEIVATTATNDVTVDNVARVVSGKEPDYALMAYIDKEQHLLLNTELLPKNSQIKKFSLIVNGHIPGLPSGSRIRRHHGKVMGRVSTNVTVGMLYLGIANELLGRGFSPKQIIYDVDTQQYPEIDVSNHRQVIADPTNFLTYEFYVATEEADSLYHFMLADLNQCSGFNGTIETRNVSCYVVQVENPRLLDYDDNPIANNRDIKLLERQSLRLLARVLDGEPVLNGKLVVDETGTDIRTSLSVDRFSSLRELQDGLKKHGLRLVETTRDISFLVISRS